MPATTKVEVRWFIKELLNETERVTQNRMAKSLEHLKRQVIQNISVPVERVGSRVVRSEPGEYPRKETGDLTASIYTHIQKRERRWEGYVATNLDYGLILETSESLNRSFLRRTFDESIQKFMADATRPF